MRPLIFSTALPPINHAWTRFILAKMPDLQARRQHLAQISLQLSQAIIPAHRASSATQEVIYQSPIVPYILGDNAQTLAKAAQLQAAGFYALPIRPPTVPANTARIRLVMNAQVSQADCQRLIEHL
jgi:8-amino-7-oxononanoate synthase